MLKKVILVIAVALLGGAILTTPVFAIGPWQALEVGNNPNFEESELEVCQFSLSNGMTIRWHDDSGVAGTNVFKKRDLTIYRPASEGEVKDGIKGADVILTTWVAPPPITNVWIVNVSRDDAKALEYENKWIYMSSDYVYPYFVLTGVPADEAAYIAYTLWPNGVFYKYVNVG